jgi:hypothetical protein
MQPIRNKFDHGIFLAIIALAGWLLPGAGQVIIGEWKRAIIIFITVCLTFTIGLYVGSIAVVDPATAPAWYAGQMLTTPLVGVLGRITMSNDMYVYGRAADVGQIYTCIAGMMNLLCIISAVYMAHSGRGEIVGTEEE